MNINSWLIKASETLIKHKIPTARLDAEVLLADSLLVDRSWLHAHGDDDLSALLSAGGRTSSSLEELVRRRTTHEPLAYIRGFQEFYGRNFNVDKFVLVPRPESEEIIEQFKLLKLPKAARVADVGCGSGALGVTAKLERPDIRLTMIDIDDNALVSAHMNADKLGVDATYLLGDLLETHTPIAYDILLCNLPYVPDDYPINNAAKHEPEIALFSGVDGLSHFRTLFKQLKTEAYGSPIVITESLLEQHDILRNIAEEAGYVQTNEADLVQVFKIVKLG